VLNRLGIGIHVVDGTVRKSRRAMGRRECPVLNRQLQIKSGQSRRKEEREVEERRKG
jgi:hypothetical protein